MQEKICLVCRKLFNDNRSNNKKFCSLKCKIKYRSIISIKITPVIKNCLFCQNEFLSRVCGRENKYCCRACSRKHYKKLNHDKIRIMENNNRAINKKDKPLLCFNNIKRSSTYRKLLFNLSYEYFINNFWHAKCNYCGSKIESAGIDRIDSSIGYEINNCVPCCKICNMMKQAHSPIFFLSHIQKIINHTAAVKPCDSDK